ncbi:11373_t:CDS:10, partial [Scutellospora calospora]
RNIMSLENSNEEINTSTAKDELIPVTKREIVGWYILCAANGIYSGAPIGVLIPLFLENLAGRAGYELDKNCRVLRFAPDQIIIQELTNYILILDLQKRFSLVYGLSAYEPFLKNFYRIIFIGWSIRYYIVSIINCCFGAANIFSTAYISMFSRIHPKVIEAKHSDVSITEIKKLEDNMTVNLSSHSSVITTFFIMLVMFAVGGILALLQSSLYGIQVALAFSGFCWLILLIFPTIWLTNRPKPPLPIGENYILYSWKRVGKIILSTRSLWQTIKLLVGWFLISDSVNTLGVVGVLFGKKQLGMTDAEITLITPLVPVFEIIGVYLLLYLQKVFHLSEKTIVIMSSVFTCILPLYSILGYWLPFGLNNKWEIWLFWIWYGISIGTIFNYCRALFAIMIPIGHENEFFSLYQITAKGSSWLGTIISGAIVNYSHNLRDPFWFLFAVSFLPVLIFFTINVEKGKQESEKYSNIE